MVRQVSVKWLADIEVLDYEFKGFFQSDRYVMPNGNGGTRPLTRIEVKSHINRPEHLEIVGPAPYLITGVAWSGHGRVSMVEVSDDGGAAWLPATLDGPDHRYAWRQWSLLWTHKQPGHRTLMARAMDDLGNCQPMEAQWNDLGYAINGVMKVCVTVRE